MLAAAACNRQAGDPSPSAPLRMTREAINIVTLGDSLAYGAGDESGRGIAGRLRDELEQRGIQTVQTTNLGVNGAQTGDVLTKLKQKRVRDALSSADAVILSIGANDLFRNPGAREETLRNPLIVADRILERISQIVIEIHQLNPKARVLILGGYNPVPRHPQAFLINQYLGLWDAAVARRFRGDQRVEIVKMSDLVVPDRLSRYDSFHPGGSAYAEAARRIATMIMQS